jgi:hypothetical protein
LSSVLGGRGAREQRGYLPKSEGREPVGMKLRGARCRPARRP